MDAFKGEFEKVISTIGADVKTAASFAKESKKPLLLIAGEEHDSLQSVLLAAALLKSASDCGIQRFAVEGSPEAITMIETLPRHERRHEYDFLLPMASKGLSMKISGVDKPDKILHSKDPYTDEEVMDAVKSSLMGEGLLQREAHMVQELLKLNENTLFITGLMHLEPIAKNPDLRKEFHVRAVSIAPLTDGMRDAEPPGRFPKLDRIFNYLIGDSQKRLKQYELSEDTCEAVMGKGADALFRFLLGPERFAVFNEALNPPQSPKSSKSRGPAPGRS
jgi:hypothetical protein